MYRIQSLHIYPLKSGRGLSRQHMVLDRFGPLGDRRWMLVDDHGRFVSQRDLPIMTRLNAVPGDSDIELSIDGYSLVVATPAPNHPAHVSIWSDEVTARDAGDEAAQWLSEQFGRSLRLVYMGEECQRRVDTEYAHRGETVSFADGFPLLLVSAASLETLNSRLTQPVALDRFRPNLVVAGCGAHAEDEWRRIRIGSVEFDLAKPCSRCAVPSLDQMTGEKHPEILRALASYRRGTDRQIYFGQNLVYASGGDITVGDAVEVLEAR
ncbi:hypothetical protein A3709_12100 [Halioglobus sp. HI00S01]|uniref:MOSC domain-containing protein n=1 Tax=Halioglobus sp. HI00S01 TaxID=1822214 RepID=UPI0007C398DC|nr:MOSC domain-containing protein [Halioglobus sp. HI00S01]KZX60326.1 hypothetical protein A3709_12100 [Halioglobus sp. HI00S01]